MIQRLWKILTGWLPTKWTVKTTGDIAGGVKFFLKDTNGKNLTKGKKMPSRKIEDCVKELQSAWEIIRTEFSSRYPGWTMQLTCTHRTPEEQFDLFKKGRVLAEDEWVVKNSKEVVTNCDGTKKVSNHNYYPSRAFDVALQNPEGEYVWNNGLPQWQSLPDIAEVAEVVNGGSWKTFKDYPHFELRETHNV